MRAKRSDKNQPQIVAAFRNCGFSVVHTHTIGGGIPDIAIGRNGHTHWVEIKSSPKEKLTPLESEFFTNDRGSHHIVWSLDCVFELSKKLP